MFSPPTSSNLLPSPPTSASPLMFSPPTSSNLLPSPPTSGSPLPPGGWGRGVGGVGGRPRKDRAHAVDPGQHGLVSPDRRHAGGPAAPAGVCPAGARG